MPFGLGSRTCNGKNIVSLWSAVVVCTDSKFAEQSMLEISKVLPEMLRRFDFGLSPGLQPRPWKTKNHWFVIPQDFNVAVRKREKSCTESGN